MIKKCLLAIMLLYCGIIRIYAFKVDGIYYTISSSLNKELTVVAGGTTSWEYYKGAVVIPEEVNYNGETYTVTKIGKDAFWTQTYVTSITIPKTITQIGGTSQDKGAFQACHQLTTVYYNGSIEDWCDITFIQPKDNPLCCATKFYVGGKAITELVIPESVTSIEKLSFYGFRGLSSVTIPNSVSTIGDKAFNGCSNLEVVYFLGATLPSHGMSVFNNTHSEKRIYVSNKNQARNVLGAYSENLIEYISFNQVKFDYNGQTHIPNFINNLSTYDVDVDFSSIEKDAGIYETTFKAVYSNGLEVDIPYTYTINKAPLTINVNDAEKIYGDENPQFTYSLSGFVNNEDESVLNGSVTFSTKATAKSGVGTYSVAASATAKNYEIGCTEGTLTVKKAPVTVAVNTKSRVYGDVNPQFDFTYVGLKNGDGVPVFTSELTTSTKATKYSDVGDYEVTVSGGVATNYSFTEYIPGTLTITQAPLGISAQSTVREYGEANPEFQFAYSGFKNEDTEECLTTLPTVVTSATPTSSVGEYEITPNGAEAKNYAISYTSGTLTVNKAPLTVQAEAAERVYGDENPKFTFAYSGFKNEETEEVFTNRPSATTEAGLTSAVGTYDIVPSGAEAQNYDITYKNGTLSVTKAPLAVGIVDNKREYGEENPAIALTYSGFKNSDNENCIAEKPAVTVNAEKKSDVGEYTISVAGGLAQNYMFTEYNEGKLTIEKAPLTVIAENKERLYFEANPEFTYRCEGFKNDDTKSVITTQPNFECSATQTSGAGDYEITLSGAGAKNYELSYQGAKLTVGKRTIDVKVGDCTRVYNEENPEFEVNYSGFVNNESEKVFTAMPTLYCSADKTTDVGSYEITASGAEAVNYDFNYKSGTLTIEKATQEIVWEQDLSEVALGDQVELTATATSGLAIEYQLADNNFVSIYEANGKVYLDCSGVGQVVIKAIQNGNKNYHAATRVNKTLVVTDPSGIENTTINDSDAPIYNLKGERMACSRKELQNGIYIQNGKKFVVK